MRLRERQRSDEHCAVCRDGPEGLVVCRGCGTLLHAACLIDVRGCPTIGCNEIDPLQKKRSYAVNAPTAAIDGMWRYDAVEEMADAEARDLAWEIKKRKNEERMPEAEFTAQHSAAVTRAEDIARYSSDGDSGLNFDAIRHGDPSIDKKVACKTCKDEGRYRVGDGTDAWWALCLSCKAAPKCKECGDKGWYPAGDKEYPRPCIWCDEGMVYAQTTSKMVLVQNGRRYLQLEDALVEVPGKRPLDGQTVKEWHEAKRKFLAGEFECAHMFAPIDHKCAYCKRSDWDVYEEMYPDKSESFIDSLLDKKEEEAYQNETVTCSGSRCYEPTNRREMFCSLCIADIEVWGEPRAEGVSPAERKRDIEQWHLRRKLRRLHSNMFWLGVVFVLFTLGVIKVIFYSGV